MKKLLKIVLPLLLVVALIASLGWYFLVYDQAFTRDLLVAEAHRQEQRGSHDFARWLYNLAYSQSSHDESVAIALAKQYLSQGNYTKAEFTLSSAIADGGDSELYIALCNVYVAQDKLLDAVTMLEQIADPDIKAEIAQLRPAAPVITPDAGFYTQYITISAAADSGTPYISCDGEYPSLNEDLYTQPISLDQGETTIYALCVGENGLVSPLVIQGYTIGGIVEPVNFADPVIEKTVRDILGIPKQTIYTNQLWEISAMTITESVSDWSDLRHFTSLTSLTMEGEHFEDLAFLDALPRLTTLSLNGCRFPTESLEYISRCTELRTLSLYDCQLSTLSGLETLTELEWLDLGNNSIRNLSAISELSKLAYLDLQHNAVDALTDLGGLTELVYLDLSYNAVTSITPLQSCTKLQHLDLSQNAIGMIDRLAPLKELNWLSLETNYLVDVSVLGTLPELHYLDLSHNAIADISGLAPLMKLGTFLFTENSVKELPKWDVNCGLIRIDGSNNQIESVEPLRGLGSLNSVVMDYNKLKDVSPLADCPVLIEVDIFGNQVAEVASLLTKNIIVRYDPTMRELAEAAAEASYGEDEDY